MQKIDDEIKLLIEKLENIHLESDDLSSLLSFLHDLVENYKIYLDYTSVSLSE